MWPPAGAAARGAAPAASSASIPLWQPVRRSGGSSSSSIPSSSSSRDPESRHVESEGGAGPSGSNSSSGGGGEHPLPPMRQLSRASTSGRGQGGSEGAGPDDRRPLLHRLALTFASALTGGWAGGWVLNALLLLLSAAAPVCFLCTPRLLLTPRNLCSCPAALVPEWLRARVSPASARRLLGVAAMFLLGCGLSLSSQFVGRRPVASGPQEVRGAACGRWERMRPRPGQPAAAEQCAAKARPTREPFLPPNLTPPPAPRWCTRSSCTWRARATCAALALRTPRRASSSTSSPTPRRRGATRGRPGTCRVRGPGPGVECWLEEG